MRNLIVWRAVYLISAGLQLLALPRTQLLHCNWGGGPSTPRSCACITSSIHHEYQSLKHSLSDPLRLGGSPDIKEVCSPFNTTPPPIQVSTHCTCIPLSFSCFLHSFECHRHYDIFLYCCTCYGFFFFFCAPFVRGVNKAVSANSHWSWLLSFDTETFLPGVANTSPLFSLFVTQLQDVAFHEPNIK